MESLKGVLTELNLRIKSPIFSSFIFAWIIINWRIVVLTIHFLTASDSGLSFNQYCVKTQELFNAIKCFWLPLISMLIYIFIIPLFKILVSFVQAKFKKWNFEAEIRGAKDGNVSINTYLGLRERYASKLNELENIIRAEGNLRNQLSIKDNELIDLQNRFDSETEKNMEFRDRYNGTRLNGTWRITLENYSGIFYHYDKPYNFKFDKIDFSYRNIVFYLPKDTKQYVGRILYFQYTKENDNSSESSLPLEFLVEIKLKDFTGLELPIYWLFKLKQFKNFSHLKGTLNDNVSVVLIKEN